MTTDFRIRCVTWNVGGITELPKDFRSLLGLKGDTEPNLIALGFQELSSGTRELLANTVYDDPWTIELTDQLALRNYVRVKTVRMVGISLLVFIQRSDMQYIKNIESELTATGYAGLWGNKGGVSIRMDISGVDVCFVNCHLPAHMPNVPDRIGNYNEILELQKFRDPGCSNILDHDYVFWIGDLNFRIDELPNDEVKKRVEAGDFDYLIQYDQLKKAMKDEAIFVDFQEGPITFAPTYKFDYNTDEYDTSYKQRKPAWTDRMLWMVHEDAFEGANLEVTQLSYTSHPEYKESDHKPVAADFNLKVLRNPPELPVMFEPLEKWISCEGGRCVYTVTSNLAVSSWDWIGLYRANFKHPDDYVTYVWASTKGDNLEDGSLMYTLTIDKSYLDELAGEYCLCYFSKAKNCLMGYSDTFRICLVEESSSSSSSDDEDSEESEGEVPPSFSPEGGARPKTGARQRRTLE